MTSLQYYFDDWVLGVFEDDPLPFEVNYILFILDKKGDYYNLEFSGHQYIDKSINSSGFFYPLEAQSFFCTEFFGLKISNQKIFKLTKTLICNFLKLPQAQFLSKTQIGLCFRYKNAVFLKQL